jgi:hypothetical protein
MPKPNEHILLAWQAPEFRHYPKNAAWYLTLLIIALLIITFQIIQKDIFGAVSIVIFTIFIYIFSRQRPRIVNIRLTTAGIGIDESFIPYKSVKHFWVVDNQNHRTLNVETTAFLNRTLILELADQDPDTVRNIMSELAPEHSETEETFAQRIMHKLKF